MKPFLKISLVLSTLALVQACGSSSSKESATKGIPANEQPATLDDASPSGDNDPVDDGVGNNVNAGDNAESPDGNTSTDSSGNDQQTVNSYCAPVTSTQVIYQNYCGFGSRACAVPDGWFVPQPSGGFSWSNDQLCDATASYGVDTIEVLVPYINRPADIDGRGGGSDPQWINAAAAGTWQGESRRNDINNLLLSPVAGYNDGAGYSVWRAFHDRTNLYVWVKVSSEALATPYSDSERFYNDDSVVLYIDGDNSKGTEYDGVNDFVAIMLAGSEDWQPEMQANSPEGLGIYYRTGTSASNISFYYEIAINLASAGITIGKPFGFDVHINEDDNGGDRDAMWGWFEQSFRNTSWENPSVLGTLLLTDCDGGNNCGAAQVIE